MSVGSTLYINRARVRESERGKVQEICTAVLAMVVAGLDWSRSPEEHRLTDSRLFDWRRKGAGPLQTQ